MEKFENNIQKINPKTEREILEKNPDIKQNSEHFIIEIKNNDGKTETYFVSKRDFIPHKTEEMKKPEHIPVEKVIEEIKNKK